MINFSVPDNHPLTKSHDAIGCVTVVDMANHECGVYPNVDRAMKYVHDWFNNDNVSNPSTLELVQINEGYWHVKVDGKVNYRIKLTCFRY